MAQYLDTQPEPDATIEVWDWEIAFLSQQAFHHPPFAVTKAMIRREQLGIPPEGEPYSLGSYQPDYIVNGPYSKRLGLYTEYMEENCHQVVKNAGYELYACQP